MLPNLEQTNLGLSYAGIRENIYNRQKPKARSLLPPAPISSTGTALTDRSEEMQQHFLYRKLQAKATNEEIKVSIPLSFSYHFCDNTRESRLHSWLGNSFNQLRQKLTHFVAGFCPFWTPLC